MIAEPVDRPLQVLLRRAVLDHATTERRRVFPAVVHVGTPGGPTAIFPLGRQRLDHALRVDVVEAMTRRVRGRDAGPGPVLLWLTRPGSREPHDVDVAWSVAARAAAAELGHALPMVVVTRRSWHDPSTGTHREWTRLRSPAPPRDSPPAPSR